MAHSIVKTSYSSTSMASRLSEEVELSKKHEEILEKRVALLERTESQYEQLRNKRRLQASSSQVARERNAGLLEDLQKMENRLSARPVLHPDIVSLETRYWASVEEKLPEWEDFLLGKAQAPTTDGRRSPGVQGQKDMARDPSQARAWGLPPRSKQRPFV